MPLFDHILHRNECQHFLTTGMCNILGLPSIISADCGQLVKMLLHLETHCIFGSNFEKLFILTFFSDTGMQNGYET